MKKKVLIIDDDITVCKEIKYSLQSETTEVYYALSAKDGFEQFAKHQFCLVIMDIQLSEYVWNQDTQYNVDELVKAHIKTLRKKLTPAGKEYIKNVWGIGYRFSSSRDVDIPPSFLPSSSLKIPDYVLFYV